ncbi:hypothetical protein UVI_02062070 [Ustilaginoidea virens]|uniref:Uncharacterized protein n=1 Tax=Ustilaginoidea virens TaxID=1159556 RepID=A0A1B5L4Z6_USTVR|nr:hypothetical protein UVI_02062070 [Ustilaginoidea virens]
MPSWLKTAAIGELDGRAAGDCVLARLAVTRSLRFRRGDLIVVGLGCGARQAATSAVMVLSPASLLVRWTDVSMAGGFGFLRRLGSLSILSALFGFQGGLGLNQDDSHEAEAGEGGRITGRHRDGAAQGRETRVGQSPGVRTWVQDILLGMGSCKLLKVGLQQVSGQRSAVSEDTLGCLTRKERGKNEERTRKERGKNEQRENSLSGSMPAPSQRRGLCFGGGQAEACPCDLGFTTVASARPSGQDVYQDSGFGIQPAIVGESQAVLIAKASEPRAGQATI